MLVLNIIRAHFVQIKFFFYTVQIEHAHLKSAHIQAPDRFNKRDMNVTATQTVRGCSVRKKKKGRGLSSQNLFIGRPLDQPGYAAPGGHQLYLQMTKTWSVSR